MTIRTALCLTGAAFLIAACSPPETSAPAASAPMPAPAPATPAVTRTPSPPGAMAYIIEPANGARVTSPVRVLFGLKGAGVAPAGVETANTGHHHLLIDTSLASNDQPIPADAQHVHFGLGQTETTVELTPGRHTLQLMLGDHLHIPHEPPIASSVITIEVIN